MSGTSFLLIPVRVTVAALASLLVPLLAAEPVAVWAHGCGTLDGSCPASGDGVVAPGQLIEASDDLVRVELIGFPGSDIILDANAAVRLTLEALPQQSGTALVIQVERGAVAVDVEGNGPYAAVIARGAAVESRPSDADFIIERGQDRDYVALAKGLLLVHLRAGLTDADGMAFQLQARQGLGASASGLSEIEQLNARPQLGRAQPIQTQAAEGSDGDWSVDEAAFLTEDPLEDGTLTPAPDATLAKPAPSPAPTQAMVSDRRPIPAPILDAPAVAIEPDLPVPPRPAHRTETTAVAAPADHNDGRMVTRADERISAGELRRAAGARGAAVFLR